MSLLNAIILLFLVIDPIGNAITSIVLLKDLPPRRKNIVVIRESLVAFIILVFFLYIGKHLLSVLNINEPALTISGAVVLFLISIRMIFTPKEGIFGDTIEGEPFIFPIATPFLAGPSAIAIVLLLASKNPDRHFDWLIALFIIWVITLICLLAGNLIFKVFRKRGALALQKLLGMILITLSIQLFIDGIKDYLG